MRAQGLVPGPELKRQVLAFPANLRHNLNKMPHLQDSLYHMMDRVERQPGLTLVLAQAEQPTKRRLVPRSPAAHRTHHKKRNHLDSHDVKNNILA